MRPTRSPFGETKIQNMRKRKGVEPNVRQVSNMDPRCSRTHRSSKTFPNFREFHSQFPYLSESDQFLYFEMMFSRKSPSPPVPLSSLERWPQTFPTLKHSGIYTKGKGRIQGVFSSLERTIPVDPVLNQKIILWNGDITRLAEIDSIVNAANNGLWPGGGVCGSIHDAAGRRLFEACKEILKKRSLVDLKDGEVVLTSGFDLDAKYVLHAVGPQGVQPLILRMTYRNCLQLCKENRLRSVAFCCISTGIFGYPGKKAAVVALDSVREWLEERPENAAAIDSIVFCTFLAEDQETYRLLTPIFFPVSGASLFPNEEESKESTSL